MDKERRKSYRRREDVEVRCPLNGEEAYALKFAIDQMRDDINELIKSNKILLKRDEEYRKRIFAGKVVLAIGGCVVYTIGWGIDHIKSVKSVIDALK